jgi:hypothetical protein
MRGKFVTALAVIAVSLASAEWIDFGTGVSEARGGNAKRRNPIDRDEDRPIIAS